MTATRCSPRSTTRPPPPARQDAADRCCEGRSRAGGVGLQANPLVRASRQAGRSVRGIGCRAGGEWRRRDHQDDRRGLDAFLSVLIERFLRGGGAQGGDRGAMVVIVHLAPTARVGESVRRTRSASPTRKLQTFVYQLTRSVQSGDRSCTPQPCRGDSCRHLSTRDVRQCVASIDLFTAAGASPSRRSNGARWRG